MRKVALVSVISFFVTLLIITGFSRSIDAQVIYGCYKTKDFKDFHIVNGPEKCKKDETAISWYAKGDVDSLASQVAALQSVVCDLAFSHNLLPLPSLCGPKLVFVSSAAYTGNLGGLTGADAKCQALATAAGFPGTFKAWLSDTTNSPSTRFTHWPLGYVRVDGVMVASSWADLTDGSLTAPINRDEYNNEILYELVWTETDATGIMLVQNCSTYSKTCNDFKSESLEDCAVTGSPSATNGGWTASEYPSMCYFNNRLYCFQQ